MKMRRSGFGFAWCRVVLFFWCALGVSARADLSLICSPNTTVACDRAWAFTDPIAFSTCPTGDGYVDFQPYSTVTSGVCPKVVTRTWTVNDYCGMTSSCSQAVTLIDTNRPSALCAGVNLVPNPSAESFHTCPFFFGQVPFAAPWYPPSVATPDYFNACSTNFVTDVPANFTGTQSPLTGQGYLGAIVYEQTLNDDSTSYREYLQVPLTAPLMAGQQYLVSFHVNLAELSPGAISSIGAHLSVGPVLLPAGNYVLPVTPQIVNPPTNILNDTTNWVLIEGLFTAAGGEDHITLGNFLSDANTPNAPHSGTNDYTYYYFDDVSVVAVCDPSVTGKTVLCGTPWTFDPPIGVDPCAGTNVTVSVASTVTNITCPLQVKRTWKLTDACGNTNAWSQSVNVEEVTPPVVLCECISSAAAAQLTTNSCEGVVPDLSPYTYCVEFACGEVTISQDPPAGSIYGPGTYSITTLVQSCSGSISTCQIPFVVNALVPTISTPTNLVVQTCSTTATVFYTVSATGNVGPVGFSPPSGSVFTQGVSVVTCVATSACGGMATNTFTVTVKPPRARWFCNLVGVGIGVGYGPIGGSATMARTGGSDYPAIFVYPDPANPTNSGIVLNPGLAESIRFSTVLDFTAPFDSGVDVMLPPDAMDPDPVPLLSFRNKGPKGYCVKANKRMASVESGLFRTIAIATNGDLHNSFTFTSAEALATEVLEIGFQPGVTSCHVTVEVDLKNGGVAVEFPGTVVMSKGRKGWDGCIYGPDRPIKKPHARVVVLPPVSTPLPPIETLNLRFTGWNEMVVEEPTIQQKGRRWGDGHVTLMKAYDDDSIDFVAAGPGSVVSVDTGYASNFAMRVDRFHGSDVVEPTEEFRMIGWPPLTTTNRPPPQTNMLRLAASTMGSGVDVFADFTQSGLSNAIVQLWGAGALVGEIPTHPATLDVPLVTIDIFPRTISSPRSGDVRLSDENGITAMSGMDCGGGVPCIGDELRIIADPAPSTAQTIHYTGLEFRIAEDMDMRISNLQTTPACTNTPIATVSATGGVVVSWEGDGFNLQGAESIDGPWYDLGVVSPVILSEGAPLRVFRLQCD